MGKTPQKRKKTVARRVLRVQAVLFILLLIYYLATFTETPVLSRARILWIETAMTTMSHQWLATMFFPKSVIDDVMSRQVFAGEATSNAALIHVDAEGGNGKKGSGVLVSQLTLDSRREPRTGELDDLGNLILVDDIEQDIMIVEVRTISYTGRVMIIPDPSRVVVQTTNSKGEKGQHIADLCDSAGGIAAVNGNGFQDADGHGSGGGIIGWTVSGGEEWGGGGKTDFTSIGFDISNRLIVGNISDFAAYSIRDLVQFMPALILDGERKVEGSAGWGIQPRTAVGQTENGTVLLAVIDGRQPGHSIGITVGELTDILLSYGAVNAGACDGGSSSVMCYNGNLMTVPSGPTNATGRFLPNALVVLRKEANNNEEQNNGS